MAIKKERNKNNYNLPIEIDEIPDVIQKTLKESIFLIQEFSLVTMKKCCCFFRNFLWILQKN